MVLCISSALCRINRERAILYVFACIIRKSVIHRNREAYTQNWEIIHK